MAALSVAFPEGWSSDFNREWGPRYWLVIFPMLAILVAVNYDAMFVNARSGLEKAAIAFGVLVLSGVGIAFQLTGLGFIYKTTGDLAEVPAIMEQQGDTPLLADFFLTSSESPDQFFRRPSFYVPTYLPDEFRTWLTEVASHGLVKFDFATAMPDPTQHVFFKTPLDPGYSLVVDGVSQRSYLATRTCRRKEITTTPQHRIESSGAIPPARTPPRRCRRDHRPRHIFLEAIANVVRAVRREIPYAHSKRKSRSQNRSHAWTPRRAFNAASTLKNKVARVS